MKKFKHGRHTRAFILLLLAQGPAYGLILLNKMETHNNTDSAAIYRTLKELEKEELVESYWDTQDPGPAKKWYIITNEGLEELDFWKKDIERRIKGLQFFLETYDEIKKQKQGDDK